MHTVGYSSFYAVYLMLPCSLFSEILAYISDTWYKTSYYCVLTILMNGVKAECPSRDPKKFLE